MTTLRIYLFGGLRVYYGEDALPPFPTYKTRSLFAYLVTFRQRPHARDVLAGTFWGDMPTAQARRNLNTTLWRLRRAIPPGYLQVQGDNIAFDPETAYWLDVAEFEDILRPVALATSAETPYLPAASIPSLQRAVELYRGDLLEGFYEDWCLVEAERLRALYLQALHGLLAYHRAGREYERALDYARRLLATDSLREDIHQQAMELYELLGRRSEALTQFEHCRSLLREELGLEPMPETIALHERIRAAGAPRMQVAPPPLPARRVPLPRTPFDDFGQAPLVGRERERSWLLARIDAGEQRGGGIVLVEGEAGVGKTRLVHEAIQHAQRKGWVILRGACYELSEPTPYHTWIEVLRSALPLQDPQDLATMPTHWLSEIALLLPELRQVFPDLPHPPSLPPQQRQAHLLQALLQYLSDLSHLRPILVVLEDLHWADSASLEALLYLSQHLQNTATLGIGTNRTEESPRHLRQVLRSLAGTAALQRIILSPLSPEDTSRLAGELLGWDAPDPRFAQRLHQETAGNPFFVIEVLKGLFEEGLLVRDHCGLWRLAGTEHTPDHVEWPLPRGIRHAVQRRLERLDKRSRGLLELAAVLGSEVDFDLLLQASGWEEEAVLEATDDLLRRQLLVEAEDRLLFTHAKIQQVIYRGIGWARRRQLHRRAGEILVELAPERTEDLAHHFYLGRQPQRALPYCLAAGERAGDLYARPSALKYYTWAIEAARQVGGSDGEQALMVALEERGHTHEYLANFAKALDDYAAMLETAKRADNRATMARAVRRDAWVRGNGLGDWEQGLRGTRRALELAREAGSERETAIALLDMGYFHNMRGEYTQALETLQEALVISKEMGDLGAQAASLQYLADTHHFLSRHSEALAAYEEAYALWEKRGNRRRAEAATLADIAYLHLSLGNLDEAEEAFRQTEATIEEIGVVDGYAGVLAGLAALHRWRGACGENRRILEQALDLEQVQGGNPYNLALVRFYQGWTRWDMGQPGRGLVHLHQALDLARQSKTPNLVVSVLNGLGRCLRLLGHAAQARGHHQESLALAQQASFAAGEAEALAELGLDRAAQGSLLIGRRYVQRAVRLARTLGPRARGESLAALAEACLAGGRLKPARALARRALELAEPRGLRPLQVGARALLGRALAGLGRQQEAEATLRRALRQADPPGYPLLRWRILFDLATILASGGRVEEAARLRSQAREVVAKISQDLEDEALQQSLRSHPPVRALLAETADQPLREGQIHFSMARLGAATGRPLRDDEHIAVLWTVDAGLEDSDLRQREGRVALRRRRLLRLLGEAHSQGGDPTEADLAQALGVSTRTIRSDVAALRQAGQHVRTRGTRETSDREPTVP